MTKNSVINWQGKSIAELQKMIVSQKAEVAMAAIEMKMHRAKDTNVVKKARRQIAIAQTIKREKMLKGENI